MSESEQVRLESPSLTATISARTGALTELIDQRTGWSMLRSGRGLSFQLLVPLPGRRNNTVSGLAQVPPHITRTGDRVELRWAEVTSAHGGVHPITVQQTWAIDDDRLTVQTRIENRSDLTVENVAAPQLGGLLPRVPGGTLTGIAHDYGSGIQQPMWPEFQNTAGYFGVDQPTQLAQGFVSSYGTPAAPYKLIQGDDEGLYVGVAAATTELVAWVAELHPGYADSMRRRAPATATAGPHAVALDFAAVHVPYIAPGETRDLTPILLRPYAGDWHRGADIYRTWRDTWFQPASQPAWAAEPHSWQQVQINSPEDELRVQFADLVEIGREAADAGVTAIQLVGYNDGGQDRNNPSHDPDPRLGGFEELKHAIAAIQQFGVKVVLFAKFNWADRSTDRFHAELIRDAVKDPYGDYYLHPGYRYETTTQLLDINTRRLVPMCFLYEHYLEECERQFQTLVDLGADGMLFDECLHHSPTLLCFDESHGHRRGAPTYANDRLLIHRLASRAPAGFLFAGEAVYDWEFDAYSFSYHRSEDEHHFPLHRYTQHTGRMMTAVTGFNDRNMIAQCLLYGYAISYEPFNFKGRLRDFPDTVAYGRQMDELRVDLRRWLWDGTFVDTDGVTVTTADGTPHHPFSVFLDHDERPAVVIANYSDDDVTVEVQLRRAAGAYRYRAIDEPDWQHTSRDVHIPASSAVVLLEAEGQSE